MNQFGRLLVGTCAAGMLCCTAAPARADTRLELGVRSGYGIAFGNLRSGTKLNGFIAGQVPLWVDLGARFAGHYYFGAYFSYGFGINGNALNDACDFDKKTSGSDLECSTSDVRLGFQYAYHFEPPGELDPWLGVGIGYEWAGVSEKAPGGATINGSYHGTEFVNLQAGLDVPVNDKFAVGPFATFGLGQYGSASESGGGASSSSEIAGKAVHEWLFLGARANYSF